jgi:putative heme iron utilization protein
VNAATLIAATPALMLATVDDDGRPQASYVPFAPLRDGLGIVVSQLAAHTRYLLARPEGCVLIVSAEPAPDGSYAQPRLSIDVRALARSRESAQAADIWSALERRHGAVAQLLRGLPDFIAFTLEPLGARLIAGFAAATDLDAAQVAEAIGSAAALAP